jgi:hypothetical protein
MKYPNVEIIAPATEGGAFAVKVDGKFAIPAPNQPGVDATGGFTGTPADDKPLPFNIATIYDTFAEAQAVQVPFNKTGGTTFDIIQSNLTGVPRFQLSPRSAMRGEDWFVPEGGLGVTGPAPATNVASGVFNVWSQEQADNQGQNPGDATTGRPPFVPETGPGTST